MVNNDKLVNEQTAGLDGLEESNIDGPTPKTAQDFVDDSKPGPGTAPETLAPLGEGLGVGGDGWTAHIPD
ncbi:hypothetical protein ACQPW1_21810 [Nocardia sp. CA-128927]|uniref:hypothetical protein n=1 Tax=Nocardia sp. CA-128927 TaxID=3239975 RepID=UPI003D98A314